MGIPPFYLFAHRGWSGCYPENTFLSIQKAVALGCNAIEFDVLMTKDRQLVLLHDRILDRTTNSTGLLSDYSYEYINTLDVGQWFSPEYENTRIPTLEAVLSLLQKVTPPILINIEIKAGCWEEQESYDNAECQIIALVKKYKLEKQVIISSFRWDFLLRFKQQSPELATALVSKDVLSDFIPRLVEFKEKYGCIAFHVKHNRLSKEFVTACHANDLRVHTYVVNNIDVLKKCLKYKVDGIFTDVPERFLYLQK